MVIMALSSMFCNFYTFGLISCVRVQKTKNVIHFIVKFARKSPPLHVVQILPLFSLLTSKRNMQQSIFKTSLNIANDQLTPVTTWYHCCSLGGVIL